MAIKKDFENQSGVIISYFRIFQLTPIKATEATPEMVKVILSGYISQDARDNGKAIIDTRTYLVEGSVDEGRKGLYAKIMELPEFEGAEEC